MSSEFRIAVIGQAAFGKDVLDALVKGGENVVGVFCSPDVEGRPVDPIKECAIEHGVPVFQFKRMRDAEAIEAFQGLDATLGVMAFVTDIVPMEILNAPELGTIQYHPSLLPKYRGPSSINWPIVYGETKTGLTIFWPDDGLDTGPVLLQKEVEITPDDTLGTLYFDKLYPIGVDAMVESVGLVKAGTAPKLVQDETQATYQSWCKSADLTVDWSKPLADVYNMIRGGDPSPGACSSINGETLKLFKASSLESDQHATPGTITRIDDDGFYVACDGGEIKVCRVQAGSARKVSAAEWVEQAGINPGSVLGG